MNDEEINNLINFIFSSCPSSVVAVHNTTVKDSALFDAMFTGYQREVFPRCGNDSSPGSVSIGIALRQIIDLV